MEQAADYLILGGGSAGCVLAARLSENPATRVLLVEAGRNLTRESMPHHVRSRYPGKAYLDPNNIWPDLEAYFATPFEGVKRTRRRYEQGRVLGGGSSVNAMVANRGAPADYDEWGELGANGWSFEAALPFFRKLERDVDYGSDKTYHGTDGPIPIRRISDQRMSPFVRSVCDTFEKQGFSRHADQNGRWEDGIFVGAIAVDDNGERVPTSVVYLSESVRKRPNLEIVTDHTAERLLIADGRVVGAEISPSGRSQKRSVYGKETIVSTGAIHTPALLMRSGLGPGAHLQEMGISTILDLPGVGANLMEHPSTAVSCYLPPSMRLADLAEHHDHAILRFTSDLTNAPAGDMHAAMIARSGWHSIGSRIGTLFIWLNKPFSRGQVRLSAPSANSEPAVDFRMLSDERDLVRLAFGFRTGAKALLQMQDDGRSGPAFPTSYSARVAAVAAEGSVNALKRGLFSAMMDMAGPARAWLLRNAITSGVDLRALLGDEQALLAALKASVGGVWHASGTCRMGRADDPMAVTDGTGLVHRMPGLRICDASLMPSIPRANTNLPTIMMAERIADLIKTGSSPQ
jgi:5-(hydroxymethyl)furfural/furfural oxidase